MFRNRSVRFVPLLCFLATFTPLVAGATGLPAIIQPLSLSYQHYDKHVMLYFEGHPKYEAVEAMISDAGGSPHVRVIMTRHDQSQVDYFNVEGDLKRFAIDAPQRESHHAAIAYACSLNGGRPEVTLDFKTADGEQVAFRFIAASEPSAKYGGLTDPEGHAGESALPVMTRATSSLADPASSISFDGNSYQLPVHTYVPLFFKGMKGYYSDHFRIGVVFAQNTLFSSVAMPKHLALGAQWRYSLGERKQDYVIDEVAEDSLHLTSEKAALLVLRRGEQLALREIRQFAARQAGDSKAEVMSIRFDPYLPYPNDTWPERVAFSISLTGSADVVTGHVEGGESGFELIPDLPDWAHTRKVKTVIREAEKRVESTIVQ